MRSCRVGLLALLATSGCGWLVGIHDPTIESRLDGLQVSVGALSPAFDPDEAAYTLDVGLGVESIRLTPEADPEAIIAIGGMTVAPGEASPPLPLALRDNA